MREEVIIFTNINFYGYQLLLVDIILDDRCGSWVPSVIFIVLLTLQQS